ncbi:hypothetical protein [uncultured Methanomethylovorans sp.]|uniref:hypothetical protein n=1 Tax=uncultured Methanomethylovorans sp. TaxID=183759 RepID=UPI002AA76A27|nr:hypothetical protein [uncultured Methanomethylovorans sp.]
MTDILSENAVTNLFGLIDGHNVLFVYSEQAKMPELAYCITSSLLEKKSIPMSMVVFNEHTNGSSEKLKPHLNLHASLTEKCDGTSIFSVGGGTCIDMTEVLMNLEEQMKLKQLVFLEDLGYLRWSHNKLPFMHFLDLLASRVKDKEGTMICTVALNALETEIQKLLFTIFDEVLYVTEDAIQMGPKKSKDDIQYAFTNESLMLKSAVSSDLKKIKEIFSLSLEERKELDKIVQEHIEDYRKA